MLQQPNFSKSTWKNVVITMVVILVAISVNDFIRISRYKAYPVKPNKEIAARQDNIYRQLSEGNRDIDWSGLDGTLEFIDNNYDCSDFKLVNLTRILYEYGDQIPAEMRAKIEKSVLGFRYWWDEPGGNSMCYWSENHQILFASAEYLLGQKYPEKIFPNSGMTGKEHADKARKRILHWMEMRWKYGFIEFNSNVYYSEDIGGMINLIDFSADEEIVKKMQIIMDLLLFDVASQNIKNMFVSASGRAYENSRKGGPRTTLGGITDFYWGRGNKLGGGIIYGLATSKKYSLPPVIAAIGRDTSNVEIRQSNGLDLSELKKEGFGSTSTKDMMMQLGMEAFTNPEIIRNTLSFVRANNMFTNGFITDLKVLDISILSALHLEPAVSRLLDSPSDGVAIQRGNTYTYKTKDYTLFAAQQHHPGTYGDQQHVAGMNIGNSFSIFHTHPALEVDQKSQSPNYWVGYGRFPDVGQDHNVSLAIYSIPAKKGILEKSLLGYTHAWFPKENFDSVVVAGNIAMGKKGSTYCAMIAKNNLTFRIKTTNNLIQPGKRVFWIMEAGSEQEDQSFGKFCERIRNNQCDFDSTKLLLTYLSGGKKYELNYKTDFKVDNTVINTNYDRFDSPYCKAARKADSFTIQYKDHSLFLDFDKMIRRFKPD